jgi:O-antigen ligase
MILRMVIAGAAVLINGSRGSWISVAVGIFAFSILYVLAKPRKIGWSILIVSLSALVFLGVQFAPTQIAAAFGKRFATFETLEEDKSFMIRELMVQKGLHLFKDSPLIGVGISRFTKDTTYLDIPQVLSYAGQTHFNSVTAHNSYVAFLAETGLAGSLPYAILLLLLGVRGFKSSLILARQQQVWALSVFAAFLGMSIHMWSINSLANTANWFVYGLVVATIVVASKQDSSVDA